MTINFVAVLLLVINLIFTHHHVVILGEGSRDVGVLSEDEESDLQRQLTVLNKPPVQTIHAPWGTYDCIEFHKQPAFDHPLLKNYTMKMSQEIVSTRSPLLETLMNQVGECPRGTVPIRRTTREDLIRSKSLSSNATPNKEYRAGISYRAKAIGETIYGASGLFNIWNPKLEKDQFSSTEIAVQSGSPEELNVIKYGWTVNPQLYGDNTTRSFGYWTGDGGKNTGCYNTLCPGFVQLHDKYTLDLPTYDTSVPCGIQKLLKASIYGDVKDPKSGRWYLTLLDNIQIGYWPSELFPAFAPGAGYIYWGGHVKAGNNGISPAMGSGQRITGKPACSGFMQDLKYVDMNNQPRQPEETEYTIECHEHYDAKYYQKSNILHFGGSGGNNCPSS